jgi:hypothetical protein
MTLSKKARIALMIVGLLLVACAAAIWLLPVLGLQDEVVRERVQTRDGSAILTRITQSGGGWLDLQSEPVAIALLSLGFVLVLVGMLPDGVVASIPTPFGEIKLRMAQLGTIVEAVVEKVPPEKVASVVTGAVEDLSERGIKGKETTPTEIDETIKRILEEEAEGEEDAGGEEEEV